ncbi:MAG: hypothetical protein NT034_00300 [Candidatus Magasanikbacteria bacterium]|nr:hypothetical protein [Candidatus Magasanikbacteria bacterium]
MLPVCLPLSANEGSITYTTSKGAVFSCKKLTDNKPDFPTCVSGVEPAKKYEYRRWCEGEKRQEGLIYDSDLGKFQCLIDHNWCTSQEGKLNPKFCIHYGECNIVSEVPTDDKCFNKH